MSIFPFIDASGVTDTKKVTDLPLLKEYAYDYAKNELLLDENGCTYLVEGNAASITSNMWKATRICLPSTR